VPHQELYNAALQRVSMDLKLPVSPTSMSVAMRQLQRRARVRGRFQGLIRASDPGHVRLSDPGTEDASSLLLRRHGALTSLTVSEDSPVIKEDLPAPFSSSPSYTYSRQALVRPSAECGVFDGDGDEFDSLAASWRPSLYVDLDSSSESDTATPTVTGRSISQPMLRRCITATERWPNRRTSQNGDFDAVDAPLFSDPNSPCSSTTSSPRVLLNSVTFTHPARRSLNQSMSDNGRSLVRQSYMQTENFRQRRLTDSDAVMNLCQSTSPVERSLETVARELGMRLDGFKSSPGESRSSKSTPPLSPSSCSPRDLHPTVKLRKLRSKGPVYHDEPRPMPPSFPVMNTDMFWDSRSHRVLRSIHTMPSRSCTQSPVSVLSRASSRNGDELSNSPSHRCSEPGQQAACVPPAALNTRRLTFV